MNARERLGDPPAAGSDGARDAMSGATASETARGDAAAGDSSASEVAALVARARTAQREYECWSQERVDGAVAAAGWAILEPARNRELAELAVAATGIGDVADKIAKNHRKTLGLLRDLHGAKSVGVIGEDKVRGLVEIARPVGVVCAITPSTNPAATPANKIINALKARNAIVVAPSPKGWSTCARLVEFIDAQLARVGAPAGLVQLLAKPVTKQSTAELMRLCDLVVATGSQANVRAAYASGTPAFGVGAGNVAAIVDESADVAAAVERIVRSKIFDNATSCSSENSVVVVAAMRDALLGALEARGAVLLDDAEKATLARLMWPDGKLAPEVIGQDAVAIAERAADFLARAPSAPETLVGSASPRVPDAERARDSVDRWRGIAARRPRILMVEEDGVGAEHPFSGEKLSPVLAIYTAADFIAAAATVERIYAYQGAGHSVGLHTTREERALELGLRLPVARVIVNQVHCVATGGAFDNGLPFSLSMGCGTWGKNNFSDNMVLRHYLNITCVSQPIAERVPTVDELLGAFFAEFGKA